VRDNGEELPSKPELGELYAATDFSNNAFRSRLRTATSVTIRQESRPLIPATAVVLQKVITQGAEASRQPPNLQDFLPA